MARTETKIIQVENTPTVINQNNENYGCFGWNVLSVQVTHSQDTKTYTKTLSDLYYGDKTVETTIINYATITYQRDTELPNRNRLLELESDFAAQSDKLSDCYFLRDSGWQGIMFGLSLKQVMLTVLMIITGVCIPWAIIYFAIKSRPYFKIKGTEYGKLSASELNSEIAKTEIRCNEIKNEAASLLR